MCARLLPHALAATEHAARLEVEALATADRLESAADYFYSRARYAEARDLYQRALAIRETRLGPDHPTTVQSRQNLAGLLAELKDRP